MTTIPSLAKAFLCSLPLALVASCGGGGDDGPSGVSGNGLEGSLAVLLPDPTNLEAEPNDTLSQAHSLGSITPGATLSVIGSITQSGSDQLDVFEFTAPSRVTIDATLTGITQTADLDIYIYDPVSLQIVQEYATPNASESGSFMAKGTFFVVVDAFMADSDYELELTARASTNFTEFEPNDAVASGNYIGTLNGGEVITLEGDGADMDSDVFLFSVTSGQLFSFELVAQGAMDDYEVNLFDVTGGLGSPMLVEAFDDPPNVESGSRVLTPMSLYALEVFPFDGNTSSPYTLTIDDAAGILGASAPTESGSGAGTVITAAPRSVRSRLTRRASKQSIVAATKDPQQLLSVTDVHTKVCRGDVIVKFRGDGVLSTDELVGVGTEVIAVDADTHLCKVRCDLDPSMSAEEAARAAFSLAATLRGRTDVEYAELDHWVTALALPQAEVRPNDTHYNLQWHYEQIGLPRAWAITTGNNAIRVAVLDTGSVSATDLTSVPGIDMISDPAIAGDGNGIDNDPTDVGDGGGPQPSSFHGAHVAGTIGANTDNGFGVAGVAWQSQLLHVRVLGIGGGSSFDIANGIRYAAGLSNTSNQVANPPADIINMSLGGPGFNQTVQNACTAAHDAGAVVIAAAGNDDSPEPFFPAAYDDVISVSAVDFERRRANYSNFHPTVDIAAPGGDVTADRNADGRPDGVLSTKPNDSVNPINFDSFSFYQGTSMAAPHVAGVAALILSVDPNLTPDQVESILRNTATDLGPAGHDNEFGDGLVNAFAAVQSAAGGGAVNPILSLDAGSALFEARTGSLRVGVSNAGGGSLLISNVNATSAVGNWLSAARVATGQVGTTDTSGIEITVNGAGLADGTYGGTVEVMSNGGTSTVAVTLVIGNAAPVQNFEVFVLAVDADTFETKAQVSVFTSGSLFYRFNDLEPGRYIVVAGTDEDGDDLICDPGEPLCGVYPSLEFTSSLDLADGQRIRDLDFPLQTTDGPQSASAGLAGFQLLESGESAASAASDYSGSAASATDEVQR